MSETTPVPASAESAAPETTPVPERLPRVAVALPPGEVNARLDAAARRGKMAGFMPGKTDGGKTGPLFVVRDFGTPFESELHAFAEASGGEKGETVLTFRRKLRPVTPAIFIALLVLAIWPGVYFTDSALSAYFPSYELYTYWWYLPLTIIPTPFAIRGALRRSAASGMVQGAEIISTIAGHLGGRVID